MSKRKSTTLIMGLVCLCCVALTCAPESPKYVLNIDRLANTDPETSDKRLKEMVAVRLIHEDKWGTHGEEVEVEEWLVGKVYFRRYELMDEPPNKFGERTKIDLRFNHFELADQVMVSFYEPIDRGEALLRLGFDSKDLLKHPHLPDTWFVCIEDSVRIYFFQWVNGGGVPETFVRSLWWSESDGGQR